MTDGSQSLRNMMFGSYKPVQLIGKGGMAKVYRCFHNQTQEVVAVKLVIQKSLTDETMLERFRIEIEAMKKVSHPYIVKLLDYQLSPEQSFLVMPYFEGGSVADRLAEKLYTPREATQLLTHLAFALDHAHHQGYVHRDLKPSNILIDGKGQTYLSDFGLAKSFDSTTSITGTGQIFGTFAYMAPELLDGAPADVRTDVYALGVILYELLTGHRPFHSENPMAYAYLHRRAMPPLPSKLNPGVPAALDGVLRHALAKSPMDRPQSTGELAREFSSTVAKLPPQEQDKRASNVPRPDITLTGTRPGGIPATGQKGSSPGVTTQPKPASRFRVIVFATLFLIGLIAASIILIVAMMKH